MANHYEEKDISCLNEEIEEELRNYNPEKEYVKQKKQFLTIQFIVPLIIIILALLKMIQLFL